MKNRKNILHIYPNFPETDQFTYKFQLSNVNTQNIDNIDLQGFLKYLGLTTQNIVQATQQYIQQHNNKAQLIYLETYSMQQTSLISNLIFSNVNIFNKRNISATVIVNSQWVCSKLQQLNKKLSGPLIISNIIKAFPQQQGFKYRHLMRVYLAATSKARIKEIIELIILNLKSAQSCLPQNMMKLRNINIPHSDANISDYAKQNLRNLEKRLSPSQRKGGKSDKSFAYIKRNGIIYNDNEQQ